VARSRRAVVQIARGAVAVHLVAVLVLVFIAAPPVVLLLTLVLAVVGIDRAIVALVHLRGRDTGGRGTVAVRAVRGAVQRNTAVADDLAELDVVGLRDLAPALTLVVQRHDTLDVLRRIGRRERVRARGGLGNAQRTTKQNGLPLLRRRAAADARVAELLRGERERDVRLAIAEVRALRVERRGLAVGIDRDRLAAVQCIHEVFDRVVRAREIADLGRNALHHRRALRVELLHERRHLRIARGGAGEEVLRRRGVRRRVYVGRVVGRVRRIRRIRVRRLAARAVRRIRDARRSRLTRLRLH